MLVDYFTYKIKLILLLLIKLKTSNLFLISIFCCSFMLGICIDLLLIIVPGAGTLSLLT
jgi:hypothetical protein